VIQWSVLNYRNDLARPPADLRGGTARRAWSGALSTVRRSLTLPITYPAWTLHTAEALITVAAIALREGKGRGTGTAQLITHRNRARDRERLRFEADLNRSIDRGEFVLFYQPCVEARLEKISSLEALIRLPRPVQSGVPLGRFIQIGEETEPIHLAPCSDTSARSLQTRAKKVGHGSGQGLAIARSIVDKHAGRISVESTPGMGTYFTLRLPLGVQAAGTS
jgi:EAL domain/Histidine kinase-, DNA gyrase B-, and HSP90-like ATPase